MPIYEYRCEHCEYELEDMQSIRAEPHKDCPSCGCPTLKRLISDGSFRLKGGGWTPKHYWTGMK